MKRGAVAQPIPIGQPVPLTAPDLERLKQPRYVASTPQKLRDSHHMIARLSASGLRGFQIAERMGYSNVRVNDLLNSPAMQELVAQYRLKVDEAFVENVDEFFSAATSNMLLAERMISDTLAEADSSGELPSLRTLDAISQGRADRFGYPKKTHNLNVNLDLADQLEKAIARSKKGPTLNSVAEPGEVRQLAPASSLRPYPTQEPTAQPQPLLRRRA